MSRQLDYSQLRYSGMDVDKSFSASLLGKDSVLLLERKRPSLLSSPLSIHDFLRVPVSDFDRELTEVGQKISHIKNDWKYNNFINFDIDELRKTQKKYDDMQAIVNQSKGKGLFYIFNDALEGRVEIPAGSGDVQICVGDTIVKDEFGRQTRIPVYVTKHC